jgi:peptidoglycan hydrolase-like protein with peptidoglycan-binding domain
MKEVTELKKGMRGEVVSDVRTMLNGLGFDAGVGEDFDEEMEDAVQRFQRARGITGDGVIGDKTKAALDLALGQLTPQKGTASTALSPTPAVQSVQPMATTGSALLSPKAWMIGLTLAVAGIGYFVWRGRHGAFKFSDFEDPSGLSEDVLAGDVQILE